MLPNLNRTVLRFAQSITLKTITQSVINHRPVNTETDKAIKATIFPSTPETLKTLTIDESLSYFTMFAVDTISPNDRIVYKAKTYRVIQDKDFSDYGYSEYVIEEVK